MPSGSEQRQRRRRAYVRCDDGEWQALTRRAAQAGVPVGAYIRRVILNAPVPPARRRRQPVKNEEALLRALAQLNRIGANVNQLAHAGNRGHWPDASLHAEVAEEIRRVLALVTQALGKG